MTRNIEILDSLYEVEKIVIPKKLRFLTSIMNSSYDGEIEEIDNNEYEKSIKNGFGDKAKKVILLTLLMGQKITLLKNLTIRKVYWFPIKLNCFYRIISYWEKTQQKRT